MKNAEAEASTHFIHIHTFQHCLFSLPWGGCGTRKKAYRGTQVYSGKCGAVTSCLGLQRLQNAKQFQGKEYLVLEFILRNGTFKGTWSTELQQYSIIREVQY